MAKQTTEPAAKKAVAATSSGKPKISKAAVVTTAKRSPVKKLAAKTPVLNKPEAKQPLSKAVEKKSKPSAGKKAVVKPTLEERYRMIEVAAYYIAEQHGFEGRADEYWVAAERQIAARLGP